MVMTNSSAGKLVTGFRFGVWMSLVCFLAGAALALSASSVCAQTKPPNSQHVEISFAESLEINHLPAVRDMKTWAQERVW